MKILSAVRHTGIILAGVFLLLGVPLLCSGGWNRLFSGDPDAVSSASVILDKPSGRYVMLINRDFHPDTATLDDWITFFEGGEILYIFEDIAVSVAEIDAGGIELANSFRSKLPENQMQVKKEDITLLLSRADHGLYDMILLSEEIARAYHAETAYLPFCEVVYISTEET
ncbi:MAG: hypothetical protein IJ106_06010 [Parasporobacterium sp.]|nr:hypothetical protein [Parasporobacterium sp.]